MTKVLQWHNGSQGRAENAKHALVSLFQLERSEKQWRKWNESLVSEGREKGREERERER